MDSAPLGSGCTPAWARAAITHPEVGGAHDRLAPIPGEAKLRGVTARRGDVVLVGVMLNLSDLLKADNQVIFFAETRILPLPGGEEEMLGAVICTQGILRLHL